MIPDAIEVNLTRKERAELEARLRAGTTEQRQLLRIRIVLEAAEGWGTREIARELDTTPTTVSLWRGRFARERRHVEADHIGSLAGELRIVALAPALATAEIDLLFAQGTPDLLRVDVAQGLRDQRSVPTGKAFGWWPIEHR